MRSFTLLSLSMLLLASTGTAQFVVDVLVRDVRSVPGRQRLAPISIDKHVVRAKVADGVAHTTVTQTFRNPNPFVVEGTYLFPLPEAAAVAAFRLEMGGKMVEGEVLEKDKASEIYEGIVRRQLDPALLEYVGRRVFRAKVFPIPERGTVTVEIAYSETLRRDGSHFEYRCPFKTDGVAPDPIAEAVFDLEIASEEPLRAVYSPSHEVDVIKKGDHQARVGFEKRGLSATRDVSVVFGVSRDRVGLTLLAHEEGADGGAFLLLLSPAEEASGGEYQAKDVVFVVDTSGSMAGEPMAQTQRALRYCVNSLRPADRFEIVSFSTEARPLFGTLQPADADKKKSALEAIDGLLARGGTNINDALVQGLSVGREKDRPLLVIFMTDGEPTIGETRTEGILQNVKKANTAMTRLFVFGVGDKVRTELLDLLAENNRGARDYVGDKEDIELTISSFFAKVASPALSEVSVSFDGVTVSEMHPRPLPDLFRGSQLLVTGRYRGRGKASVKVSGLENGEKIERTYPVAFESAGERTAFVPRLWAVRQVGYLLDQMRLSGKTKEVEAEVVRLGKTYGIVTPYTSYLVVEDAKQVAESASRGGRWAEPLTDAPSRDTTTYEEEERKVDLDGFLTRRRRSDEPALGASTGPAAKPGDNGAPGQERGAPPATTAPAPSEGVPGKGVAGGGAAGSTGRPSDGANAERLRGERERLQRELKDYEGQAVTLSEQLKSLREARTANGRATDSLVRRVGNRTFYFRNDFFVEATLLDLSADAIQKRLVEVVVFSPEYFALAKDPELAKVLALGSQIVFTRGDQIIQLTPAAPTPGGR